MGGSATEKAIAVPEELALFLSALFTDRDTILFRFVETWTEPDGKKGNRVVYRETRHYPRDSYLTPNHWARILDVAERERANVFFGVCPRFGRKQYDLAWQIRVVRVLWADLDHCTPEEALKRCEAAALPRPSIVVGSGHGVHLYWLLAEPYLIDDAGDPPPVLKEFIEQGPGKKKLVREYIERPDGSKLYKHPDPKKKCRDLEWPECSPKARQVQNVAAGIAAKIGGDHTQDLSRLMRVPFTWNRKDQRNGKAPVLCELVECDPARKYAFAEFERFVEAAPEVIEEKEASKVKLPSGWKLTATRLNKLSDLVNACAVAEDRSRADWRLCCFAVERGADREEIWQQVKAVGKFGERGRAYFDHTWEKAERKTRLRVYRKVARKATGEAGRNGKGGHGNGKGGDHAPAGPFPCTDQGNGERLHARHGGDIRYCFAWSKWLVWDRRRWAIDQTGAVERLAKKTVRRIYHEAAAAESRAQKEALADHALKSEDARRIAAMIALARSEPGIAVLPEQLDRDPWLLNCRNGTLDLRTGELREPKREDYLTKLCPTDYRVDAEAPVWRAFLETIFDGRQGLIGYVQRLLGYCLTGDVGEQILPIFWGAGANGKSTLVGAVLDVLGADYGMKAATDLLMVKKGEVHPTEKADLFGMRFVVCNETEKCRRLAEALVKDLTGGDKVRARRMREDFWEFDPTHKVILCTNHKPEIRGTDHAIWRRPKLVPFTVTIPDHKQDKQLPHKLRAERAGILAWCVRGCLDWQREGLNTPEEVRQATTAYRGEQDQLAAFLAECCHQGPEWRTTAGNLYGVYRVWCEENGESHTMPQRAFGMALTERGIERYLDNGTKYRGVATREEWLAKWEQRKERKEGR